MRIRSHLLLLVARALLPLLVFATALTAYSGWQQRNRIEVRQLERVRAVTIALDTEIDASIRVRSVLAEDAGRWPLVEDVAADFMYVRLHGDKEVYASSYSGEALDRWPRASARGARAASRLMR